MIREASATCNGNGQQTKRFTDAWTHPQDRGGLPIFTAAELAFVFPTLRPVVIDGLLRLGETMNIIAASKIGKSWLIYALALSVALGRRFLNLFDTTPGDVLLIDNELHGETIAYRLPKVAKAMLIPFAEVEDKVHILPLRGCLQDLHKLKPQLMALEPGRFKLVIVDAFYRALPAGTDENSNAEIAELYNTVDAIADKLGASFAFVHHASKGNQSEKVVTDVGSGAGSQSRAADAHLVLRPHEQAGAVVLEAAVRSFAPVTPACLKWYFPLWTPAPDLDPTKLRPARPKRPKAESEGKPKVTWTAAKFVDEFGTSEPMPKSVLLDNAAEAGLSERKVAQLFTAAIDRELLFGWKEGGAASRTLVSTNKPPKNAVKPEKTGAKRAPG